MKLRDLDGRRNAAAGIRDVASKTLDKTHGSKPPADALRPTRLADFVGQREMKAQLQTILDATRNGGRKMDHVLMTGPGGLGKTTVALLMANELNVPLVATTAPTLGQEPLTRMLSGIEPGTLLFVDEIHRISKRTEELLYTALEDGKIDCNTPIGFVRREIAPFTLIGATTLPGKMTESFKDRFGYTATLRYYSIDELAEIATQSARTLKCNLSKEAAILIGERARGVARVANQYLRRLRDYAETRNEPTITGDVAEAAFTLFGVDELGLDSVAQDVMVAIALKFNQGPVGLENVALAIGQDPNTVADDVEPYLVRLGLLARTPRGRLLTPDGIEHTRDILATRGEITV